MTHAPLATIETPAGPVTIRLLASGDSFDEITALLHRGYAPLAAMGFKFFATHQGVDVTRERCEKGTTFVGLLHPARPIDHHTEAGPATRLVATVTVRLPSNTSGSPWYDRPDVTSFGQFTVDPCFQRLGIGEVLVALCEDEARRRGAAHLALDTAEGAAHLIAWYSRLGYTFVEHVRWPDVNYRSVILSKRL